jgi:hypothetical protein
MTDLQSEERKLQWEIQQIAMAIDYFERAIVESYWTKEVEKHKATIHKLQGQKRELERKHDAIASC